MVNLAAVKVGPVRYNSPWTQITILGFVVFCSVGMFSAIGGLGAGGIQDVQLYAISNAVLYACFCFAGFVAGSVNNLLGPRLTMSLGTVGYSIYVGSLWAHQVHGIRIFLIVAGGFLGITAALLWAAQGAIMMAYPLEKDKGRSFALFWCLFQSGTLVGAAIALGIQFNSTLPTIGTGVYLAFMIIMLTAIVTSWLILPPQYVVRGDGTVVEIEASISPKQEFREFLQLFKDWRMLALFPMFFSSNYFYAYQGAITAVLFNGRTRALVSLLTGLGSLSGAILLGFLTDRLPFKRRNRAMSACLVVLIINCIIWGAGLGFQVQFNRASIEADEVLLGAVTPWDFTQSSSAGGPISLLMFYYVGDAAYQGLAYYTMSSLTNDPYKLARMAGYYKGVQSAGAAVSFGMDAVRTPYLAEHLVSWLLLLVSLPLCYLVLYHVRDTNYDVERTTHVEEVDSEKVHGAAMPRGHHTHDDNHSGLGVVGRTMSGGEEEKKDANVQNVVLSS